jgi:hypothetical protein
VRGDVYRSGMFDGATSFQQTLPETLQRPE